ncbi:uncharacterized protein LOC141592498 [Silene latifolia]|uniref:uncharacterized protein LOC141592498 n=1 Tax=Silene latifolia TaxID=37657 RepID=UPI003D775262
MEVTTMEGLETNQPYNHEPDNDFCISILNKFTPTSSSNEFHQHICKIIGEISQELTDRHVSLSNIAYFGAIYSSLRNLVLDPTSSTPSLDALVVLLSLVLPTISSGISSKKKTEFLELVDRVLRGGRVSENGVVAGLKCFCQLLLIRRESCCWDDVANYYAFLLNYVTDSNPKVRKQSHTCIRDVLQSFQGSPFLPSASEGFTNMLEKLLLFTGSSKGAPAEKGAQEILHVLEALKDCLPYLSMKNKTCILKHYKTLLGLRKPLVTRRISDSLNILCLHPTVEVNPEVLVDVLSLLAVSNPVDETSADGLTFTARLLDVGMTKVHNLNREICVNKLPVILNSLQDAFGSGFEGAKLAATEAMKNLIQTCIDEDLIKEGVNRIKTTSDLNNKKSVPSVIEKLCATIGSLIDNRYRDEWDMAFQVVAVMFDKLGDSSCLLMKGTLENLANIEKESGENFAERKQLQECIGSALGAMGPELFLSILPLKLQADISEINDWLFPILKQYTVGARLGFYDESLLVEVEHLKQKSQKLKLEGRIQLSRVVDSVIYHIWSLLPAFCNYSSDTSKSLNFLKKLLHIARVGESDLHGIICSSLQILIQQNKCVLEGTSYLQRGRPTISSERAISRYSKEVATANLAVLGDSALDPFSALSEVYQKSSKDPGGSLLATLGVFASIADKQRVSVFFMETMTKLLKVTQDVGRMENSKSSMQIDNNSLSHQRAQLFDLAVSLLPGLEISQTELLYCAMKPALKDVDGSIQKKAYKVLSMVLKNSDWFIAKWHGDLVNLMIEVLPSCHFSAKRHRLDCLYHLIVYKAKDETELKRVEIISSFLTEIILALKEANKKTRNRAYDVLVQIGRAFEDEDISGKKGRLHQFFDMVAGCLVGETPHMISAAVKGLARLTYEFSDLLSAAYQVLPLSFLLLQRKNKEIIKANLGLLKVLVAKSQSENLHNHLNVMVEGLLKWPCETKNHFKAKVKHLLEMLVKKCGLDAVKAVMPEEHMKLLTNIRKIKERREKKFAASSETGSYLSKATTSRRSEWGHTKIFSDFGEETSNADTSVGRRSMLSSKVKSNASSLRKTTKSGKTLSEDFLHQIEDEPLDLLDQRKTRLALRSGGHLKRKHDSDDELEIDEDGKLIIPDEGKLKNMQSSDHDSDDDERSEVASFVSKKSNKGQKRRKTSESGWAYTGKEYASKKARGDLKKKGKLEPYAYWPLDRKMLSRRPEHRASARRGMASVVKLTKRLEGKSVANALAVKGSKSKKVHKKR